MLYSMNQVALYLNLAAARVKADRNLGYLMGPNAPMLAGGGNLQETQILFVRDALWIANNDDADTSLQQSMLTMLHIGTPDALIDHVDAYQTRVFKRIKAGKREVFARTGAPAENLLAELARLDDKGEKRELDYPNALNSLPVSGKTPSAYSLQSSDSSGAKPAVSGIVFVRGHYEGKSGTGPNEHAEQKLLAALSRVPEHIHGTLPLYGCKRQCSICKKVFDEATPRLHQSQRYLNCRAHDDTKIENYQAQAHPSNIKELNVDHYFS